MKIKQIIIQNFQSYKTEVLDNVSENINLILGKNGHGKSNIINAVTFVLTDRYTITRDDERIAILNQLANPAIDNISVEIKFDNTDRKVPIENDEISLKRVVGPENKSEHLLNNRVITKHELENTLSCCGISMTNPYNIIQQGRIHKIAQMSEKDLYNILQEIIGTNQYESKKAESVKLFDQIVKEKVKASDMLEEISKHIDELNNEKELYEEYESGEAEALCIEFCVYQKHLQEIQRKLDGFTAQYNGVLEKFTNYKNEEIDLLNDKEKLKNDIQELQYREQVSMNKENALLEDMRDLELKKEKINIQLNNLDVAKVSPSQIITSTPVFDDPVQAQSRVDELEGLLRNVSQDVGRKDTELNQARGQLHELTKQLDTIYVKKSGTTSFKSVQEKKQYYAGLVKDTEKAIQKSQDQITECQNIIKNNSDVLAVNREKISKLSQILKTSSADLDTTSNSISEALQTKNEIASKVKSLISRINQEKSSYEEAKKNSSKLQRTLQQAMRDNLLYTVEGIMDLVKARKIQGVHGLLIDLIAIPERLNICCDIVLKNKLFGFVVDTPETAATLLSFNKEIKGSMINIYPLSWVSELKNKSIEYPGGNDVVIVKNHVKPKQNLPVDIQPLIEYIFGKLLLVRDYHTATIMAKRYKLNCVTAEGELVYAGSYLTKLGFYDVRDEALSVYLQYKEVKDGLDEIKESIGYAELEQDNLSNQDLQTTQALQKHYIKKTELSQSLVGARAELKQLVNTNLVLEKMNSENEGYIKLYEEEIVGLRAKIEVYEKEKSNPTLDTGSKLKDDEKKQAEQLSTSINTAKEKIRKAELELGELQQSYKETHEELEKIKASMQGQVAKTDVGYESERLKKELVLIGTQRDNVKAALKKVQEDRKKASDEIGKTEAEIKGVEDRQKEASKWKSGLEEELMKINLEKNAFVEAKDVYMRKINQMDHVKSDMISQFSSKTIKELLSKLESLRREKKKFTAKDKVLFERLDALNQKFDQFSNKLKDLEKNGEDAQQLIQTFDSSIQDKISKIFRSFSQHLQKYFSKITGGGKITAKLLKERTTRPAGRRDADSQKYVAISLSVAFNGDDEEEKENVPENVGREQGEKAMSSMTSLSAGQKTVVATAFIFALQRCDPAPFYFLDEFDAALDTNFRRNIAQIIYENSSYSQYFITTFKTELLGAANASLFEVRFDGQVSKILQIDVNRAQEILDQAEPDSQNGNDEDL